MNRWSITHKGPYKIHCYVVSSGNKFLGQFNLKGREAIEGLLAGDLSDKYGELPPKAVQKLNQVLEIGTGIKADKVGAAYASGDGFGGELYVCVGKWKGPYDIYRDEEKDGWFYIYIGRNDEDANETIKDCYNDPEYRWMDHMLKFKLGEVLKVTATPSRFVIQKNKYTMDTNRISKIMEQYGYLNTGAMSKSEKAFRDALQAQGIKEDPQQYKKKILECLPPAILAQADDEWKTVLEFLNAF